MKVSEHYNKQKPERHDSQLGYPAWIILDDESESEVHEVPPREGRQKTVAHCHPLLVATALHQSLIRGVRIGDRIQGVRWFE